MASSPKREYKDRVFRDLFGAEERKENALSLYNALAGTDYKNPDELELTTLDDVLYVNMRNDVSFLIGDDMVIWEHQSTKNPNMPLRGLMYFGKLYSKLIKLRGLNEYSSALLELPTPRYVVLYNGSEKPAKELHLSDSYKGPGDLEVIAHVVNVNIDSGEPALDICRPLGGYAMLVSKVREFSRTMEFPDAVDAAVDWCIRHDYLADYLIARRAEVKDMLMTDWDEERYKKLMEKEYREQGLAEGRAVGREQGLAEGRAEGLAEGKAEGRAEGKAEGLAEGRAEGLAEGLEEGEKRYAALVDFLLGQGRVEDIKLANSDAAAREELFKELENA